MAAAAIVLPDVAEGSFEGTKAFTLVPAALALLPNLASLALKSSMFCQIFGLAL